MKKLYFFLALSFIYTCQPTFQTRYEYIPPITDSAKMCVLQCENTKLQFDQLEDLKYQNCTRDVKAEVAAQKNAGQQVTFTKSCIKTNVCIENYNRCFLNCGGGYNEIKECVQNCDELPIEQKLQKTENKPQSNK